MSYLSVPGAKLHYETTGSGPVLLLIAGGTDDARDFTGVVPLLADDFTVVTYDCRGIFRSRLDGPPRDVPIHQQAEDALRLLDAVTSEPAYVFGSSSGGQTGLALAAGRPGRIRALIAHEPPANGLLPDGDPWRTVVPKIQSIYRSSGAGPAMLAFVNAAGLHTFRHPERNKPESAEAAEETQERLVRLNHNMDYFLAHVVGPAAAYVPDIAALSAGAPPITVAVGDASEGQMAHATALALAARLGLKPETFPGGHAGFVTHPTRFARRVREVFAAE